MSQRNNQDQKSNLAIAIAGGRTVAAWAKANDVARRTAHSWSKSPEVRDLVARIRRRAIDRAVGLLSRNATAAAKRPASLAKGAASESVQLQAARAILADLMSVSNYAEMEGRLAEVERQLAEDHADDSPVAMTPPN
jgi:hypothetical protein